MAKRFPEFPTDWHQETYVANLERELAGARARGEEAYVENVLAELKRLGHGEKPDKQEKATEPEPKVEATTKAKAK
jgi:hypothetical protein